MDFPDIFEFRILGITAENLLWFFIILIVGIVLKRQISKWIARLLYNIFKRYFREAGIQKFIQLMTAPVELICTILIVFLAYDRLGIPESWNLQSEEKFGLSMVISRTFGALFIISFFWIMLRLVDFIAVIFLERSRKTDSFSDDQMVSFLKEGIKVIVVGIGFFILLSVVFKLDIVSLVAGLGIGGLAIALAARETLENLLGSFTIFFDKPFVVGDAVRIGTVEGKVESVGFRSTSIRAVDKMRVTVPNKKMIDAELINETDRLQRRSSFIITVGFETDEEKLINILNDIRMMLESELKIETSSITVRFRTIGQTGLEIQIIFNVLTPDMTEFLIIQERVNFAILRIVRNNKSSLSIPSFLREGLPDGKNRIGFTAIPTQNPD